MIVHILIESSLTVGIPSSLLRRSSLVYASPILYHLHLNMIEIFM